MLSYRFTEDAERDLEEIVAYTEEQWGSAQALHYLEGLEAKAALLVEYPAMGRDVSAYYQDLRAIPYESHVLYYIQDHTPIVIIRVLHTSMLPKKHLFGLV